MPIRGEPRLGAANVRFLSPKTEITAGVKGDKRRDGLIAFQQALVAHNAA